MTMTRFNVSDRVLAVVPNGAAEVTIVEGFITGVEQDGRLVAVRPAAPDEWDEGVMHDDEFALSWWWNADSVFHVVDAEKACDLCSRMNTDEFHQGGDCDELGVDL